MSRMVDYATVIGLIAGALTTLSFVPQAVRIWKTKSTKDISLHMYIGFCFGVFLWLVYGLLINSLPVIITNVVTLVLALAILAMKLKYK